MDLNDSTKVSATVNFNPTFVTILSGDNWSFTQLRFPSDIAQLNDVRPVQPVIDFPSTRIGGRPRSCQASWFQQHPRLEYSVERAAAAVHVDCLAEILQILLLSTQMVIATGSTHQEKQDICIFMLIQPLI